MCSIKSVFNKHNEMDIQMNEETNAEEFRGIRRERKRFSYDNRKYLP